MKVDATWPRRQTCFGSLMLIHDELIHLLWVDYVD